VLQPDIDVATTVLLLIGLMLFSRGVGRQIEPVEAIAMAVVTIVVLDVPAVLREAPPATGTWILIAGIFLALAGAVWSEVPPLLDPNSRSGALRSVGLACLAPSLTLCLAWAVPGAANVTVFEGLVGAVLPLISLPLAVLLVSRAVRRPQQGSGAESVG
jgi:hypothetical protein